MSRKGLLEETVFRLTEATLVFVSIYLTANIRLFRQASSHVSLKILHEISYKSRKNSPFGGVGCRGWNRFYLV